MAGALGLPRATEGAVLVSDVVLAAGGVPTRGAPGAREVLLVHRPRYDDWTLPKGKLDIGEAPEYGAAREVAEETGCRCELGPELPSVSYTDALGRPKLVRYWTMRVLDRAAVEPNEEIDATRWVPAVDAPELLSYPRDVATLDAALALDEPLYVVRHAKAGSRSDWRGDDDDRPISDKGERQAVRLAEHLGLADVRRIVSSPSLRCVQTVVPMADAFARPLERDEVLREDADPRTALAFAAGLPGPSVVCTHGNIVQDLVLAAAAVRPLAGSYAWKKGSTWIVERDAGRPVRARYVPPPRDRIE